MENKNLIKSVIKQMIKESRPLEQTVSTSNIGTDDQIFKLGMDNDFPGRANMLKNAGFTAFDSDLFCIEFPKLGRKKLQDVWIDIASKGTRYYFQQKAYLHGDVSHALKHGVELNSKAYTSAISSVKNYLNSQKNIIVCGYNGKKLVVFLDKSSRFGRESAAAIRSISKSYPIQYRWYGTDAKLNSNQIVIDDQGNVKSNRGQRVDTFDGNITLGIAVNTVDRANDGIEAQKSGGILEFSATEEPTIKAAYDIFIDQFFNSYYKPMLTVSDPTPLQGRISQILSRSIVITDDDMERFTKDALLEYALDNNINRDEIKNISMNMFDLIKIICNQIDRYINPERTIAIETDRFIYVLDLRNANILILNKTRSGQIKVQSFYGIKSIKQQSVKTGIARGSKDLNVYSALLMMYRTPIAGTRSIPGELIFPAMIYQLSQYKKASSGQKYSSNVLNLSGVFNRFFKHIVKNFK